MRPDDSVAQSPSSTPEPSYDDEMATQFCPEFGVIPGRAMGDMRIRPNDYRLLTIMCGYANRRDHICWPKQATLAKIMHTSVPFVSRMIGRLEALGYVEIVKRGYPLSNVYRIIWHAQERSDLSSQTTQTCPARQPRLVQPDKSHLSSQTSKNIPIEHTNVTPYSEDSNLSTSLAQRADNAPLTTASVQAPTQERRTRERDFDTTALRRDPLFIALATALPEPITYDEWRTWATMIGRLHRAGVSAADIPRALQGYSQLYPSAVVTIRALVNHWSEIREGHSREQRQLAVTRNSSATARAAREAEAQRNHELARIEMERIEREWADELG